MKPNRYTDFRALPQFTDEWRPRQVGRPVHVDTRPLSTERANGTAGTKVGRRGPRPNNCECSGSMGRPRQAGKTALKGSRVEEAHPSCMTPEGYSHAAVLCSPVASCRLRCMQHSTRRYNVPC